MRIVKLHHPTVHAYWNRGEFRVEMPDGSFIDTDALMRHKMGFEIWIGPTGDVMFAECACSSGGGKKRFYNPQESWCDRYAWAKPRVIVSRNQYDQVEYVGAPLVMSQTLVDDLRENHIS